MNCPHCGTPNADQNRFCLKCGKPIAPQSPPQQSAGGARMSSLMQGIPQQSAPRPQQPRPQQQQPAPANYPPQQPPPQQPVYFPCSKIIKMHPCCNSRNTCLHPAVRLVFQCSIFGDHLQVMEPAVATLDG
ncbi:zinc-ribbon domain-containing protein, partial [bacterium]|nr:zinc-ribbon domain-containing protein [bacterium]